MLVVGSDGAATALAKSPVGIAVTSSGTAGFILGCSPRPVLRGTLAGATPVVVHQPDPTPFTGEHFSCMAADPAGGFFFVVASTSFGSPRLYHLPEDAVAGTPMTLVATEPSLGELFGSSGATTFPNCAMTVASNGVIYIQASSVYRIGL